MGDDLTKLNIARREPMVDITSIPEKRVEDVVHEAAKLVVAVIPGFSDIAGKSLEFLIAPSLGRRKDEWVQSIALQLVELQKVGRLRVEDVVNDKRFVSAVMHALHSAVKSHQEEKLEALRNAVLHTALGTAPDDDLTHIFLNLVDEFTPLHLTFLTFLSSLTPRSVKESTAEYLFEKRYPDAKARRPVYQIVIQDLVSRGLVHRKLDLVQKKKGYARTANGLQRKFETAQEYSLRPSSLAASFIAFVRAPSQPVDNQEAETPSTVAGDAI